jgi:hypothetical protein
MATTALHRFYVQINPLPQRTEKKGCYPKRIGEARVLLDAATLFGKLHFLYGHDDTTDSR